MSTNNPYAFNPLDVRQEDPSDHPDFGRVLRALSETRPWVRILGIVLIITPVLLFFGGAWMSPGILRFGGIRSGGFFTLLMSGSWGISLVGYLLIGIQLLGYASLIHKAEVSLNMNAVAAAVEKQQTLWKYAALFCDHDPVVIQSAIADRAGANSAAVNLERHGVQDHEFSLSAGEPPWKLGEYRTTDT